MEGERCDGEEIHSGDVLGCSQFSIVKCPRIEMIAGPSVASKLEALWTSLSWPGGRDLINSGFACF